ncbi:MAG: bifunctional PIG-L family deacetylase/class I SAM-dependent methyltransferase [Actinomycetota bacterium]|nr:bifunctional PIG-L family deacetylase/class I SAM-dependent methyltransferase [Actinomycetota bacterium]
MTRPTVEESEWEPVLIGRTLPSFDVAAPRRGVIVAAHPDDETLGVGGLVQALHATGTQLSLVVATDGEAAFPSLEPPARAALGLRRRDELADALVALGTPDVDVHFLGLPDSGLAEHEAELVERLTELSRDADVVMVPWPGDPHPDHAAAGRAGLAAAPVHAHRFSYPIWMWHWMSTDDPLIPWDRAVAHRLSPASRARKDRALAAFASQLERGPNGEDPIVDEAMVSHFRRDREVLFREPPGESAPVARFAALYRADPDPWDTAGRWYEQRKRALVLASLPRRRYRRALEPACGTGELTRELTERCDEVVAFDPVPEAVARARATAPEARVEIGALPDAITSEPVDLAVLSEILYYLGDDDLTASLDRLIDVLEPGGHLVAVHWRPWAPEAPRDGAAAHRVLLDRRELTTLVAHEEADFLLHVLRRE